MFIVRYILIHAHIHKWHKYCHLVLKPPASLRARVWLLFCKQPGSHDTAVWTGVPWAEWWSSAGCIQFDIKWEQGSHWAKFRSDLTGAQISSAVVPSGCGTVLKLRAALICFTICTVEAGLGLLGNYEHVPHSSKVESLFPGVVIFVFV